MIGNIAIAKQVGWVMVRVMMTLLMIVVVILNMTVNMVIAKMAGTGDGESDCQNGT